MNMGGTTSKTEADEPKAIWTSLAMTVEVCQVEATEILMDVFLTSGCFD